MLAGKDHGIRKTPLSWEMKSMRKAITRKIKKNSKATLVEDRCPGYQIRILGDVHLTPSGKARSTSTLIALFRRIVIL